MGPQIAERINRLVKQCGATTVYVPFLGVGTVAKHIRAPNVMASDSNGDLMQLWIALQANEFDVPDSKVITLENFDLMRNKSEPFPANATRAFFGVCAGSERVYFDAPDGADRMSDKAFASNAQKRLNVLKKIATGPMNRTNFLMDKKKPKNYGRDYRDWSWNEYANETTCIIYADPPDPGAGGLYYDPQSRQETKFDHAEFWRTALTWARDDGYFVLVTFRGSPPSNQRKYWLPVYQGDDEGDDHSVRRRHGGTVRSSRANSSALVMWMAFPGLKTPPVRKRPLCDCTDDNDRDAPLKPARSALRTKRAESDAASDDQYSDDDQGSDAGSATSVRTMAVADILSNGREHKERNGRDGRSSRNGSSRRREIEDVDPDDVLGDVDPDFEFDEDTDIDPPEPPRRSAGRVPNPKGSSRRSTHANGRASASNGHASRRHVLPVDGYEEELGRYTD